MHRRQSLALICAVGMVTALIVYFVIPVSPMRTAFNRDMRRFSSDQKFSIDDVFTADDFADFPKAVQKFAQNSGLVGQPKMNYVKVTFQETDFKRSRTSNPLRISYTQYNFAARPTRLALIQTSMFGVPFEGYDYLKDGRGGMKGQLAKSITLFHERGQIMDKAALCTYLAESLLVPSALLNRSIDFEEISSREVRATITSQGTSASGIFKFNEDFMFESFYTEDRAAVSDDGTIEYIPWTANCSDHAVNKNGIIQPRSMSATWNYPGEDFTYFDGRVDDIVYG